MLEWLKEFWVVGEPFRKGFVISLSGEEKYVKEGYIAAANDQNVNPYSGSNAKHWQRGWRNYQHSAKKIP